MRSRLSIKSINIINILVISFNNIIQAEPLNPRFTSCISQHSDSISTSDQLINFHQLFTQLDHSTLSHQPILRFSLHGNVSTQSLGYSSRTNFLATLITESSVLNFQTFFNQSALCSSIRTPNYLASNFSTPTTPDQSNSSLASNSGCPYGPGDLALGFSIPLTSTFPFTSISTQLHLLDTSTPALTLACVQFDSTPYYPHQFYYKIIFWIPVALTITYLIASWTARIWAAKISEQLDHEARVATSISDPYNPANFDSMPHWALIWWNTWAGQGLLVSGALLRFATPSARDIIWHAQFVTCLGLFAVQWPDFFYPIVAQTAWSTLVFNSSFINSFRSSSHLPVDALATPPYDPPSPFVTQMDDPQSPIYLNRNLPNQLLNLRPESPGFERWAKILGIQSTQVFGTSAVFFGIICGVAIVWGVICYIIDVSISCLNHRKEMAATEIDDGVGYESRDGRAPSKELEDIVRDGSTSAQSPWWQPKLSGGFREKSPKRPPQRRLSGIGPKGFSRFTHASAWRLHWASLQGNLTRIILLFYYPMISFASYQLSLFGTASTSSIAVAVVFLFLFVSVPVLQIYRIKKRTPVQLLDDLPTILALGPLYNTYADRNEIFIAVRLCSALVVGIALGASQSMAIIHAVVLLVAEMTETTLTSLWLPWGDGAAMAPLSFVFSVSRIITAVILVVLTPTVSLGSIATGWLTYVILLLQAIVFLLLLLMLLVKIVELGLRLIAHIPFDETRSTRSGGLKGAIRRWDRNGNRTTRHGRAAAIAARRRRRRRIKQSGSTSLGLGIKQPSNTLPPRTSIQFLDGQLKGSVSGLSTSHPLIRQEQDDMRNRINVLSHGHQSPVGMIGMNDDDGNIMSAMSQGPWLRTQPPFELNTIPSAHHESHHPVHTPPKPPPTTAVASSGFAVVRGGRATEKTPYEVHDDGRRRDYPPMAHQAPSTSGFSSFTGSGNRTTTNLFDQPDHHTTSPRIENQKKKIARKNKRTMWRIGGLSNRRRNESSSEDDETTEEEEEEDDEPREGKSRIGRLFGNWKRSSTTYQRRSSTEDELIEEEGNVEPTSSGGGGGTKTFEVVRQPRLKPSPALVHTPVTSLGLGGGGDDTDL
ncbi:uncharacterized protein MELLADRAFT_115893 [Melampsora larici-populina 98AG31]|uniref:TRP C-terminal domain-containing protein n=1 Tax=Melampsora larici-populina (strain 98AG31 / pathotype 3-4-7) TaxID=747676 RepID=F4RFH8_MELLP|nr:uncharacterized protein MELLADRAFT_115893 [Melampsora larici-populina 98AG31]EGG08810.1 hypothetical protein MELLADRAFT_115893 [Melampsora larici-populina 98AG31]